VVRLAEEVCGGRIIDTAGGGYNPTSLGRIWALQLTALMGVTIGDDLPDEWRRTAEMALGGEAPHSLREDPGPECCTDQRADGDRMGLENVARAEALLEM